jgi:hypothetical protein
VLGGKTVCVPVERTSTIMPDERLENFFVTSGAVTRYSQCERGLAGRPNTSVRRRQELRRQFHGPRVIQVHVDQPA